MNYEQSKDGSYLLRTMELVLGYAGRKQKKVISSVLNLVLHPGELVALIGKNGTGKSSLIRTLTGLQKPLSGTILICGKKLNHLSARQLATCMSLVLTDKVSVQQLTVNHLVEMGRYPHTGWFGRLNTKDKELVNQALEWVGTLPFAKHYVGELSDGEQQRVMIARALAQDTPLLFLDEPTAHLDISSKIEVMSLLKRLTVAVKKTVLLATHQLDLALRIADKLWLLQTDGSIICGTPQELGNSGVLTKIFASEYMDFNSKTLTLEMHNLKI